MRVKSFGCLAALLLVACANVKTTEPGVVGVDRLQYMSTPAEQYNQSMAAFYASLLADVAKEQALNQDDALVQRLRAIAGRMIAHTAIFRPDAPAWNWEVNVIGSWEVNAFCLAGGKIAVFSGMIERLHLTDDEIAAVMGHEIAHALREHGRERVSQRMRSQFGAGLIGAVFGAGRDEAGELTDLFYLLPNSREQETEADRIGVELAARAGYDPRGALSLWRKMQLRMAGHPPQHLATHPSYKSRLKDLQYYSDKVAGLYKPPLKNE